MREKREDMHIMLFTNYLVSACLVNLPLYFAQFPRAAFIGFFGLLSLDLRKPLIGYFHFSGRLVKDTCVINVSIPIETADFFFLFVQNYLLFLWSHINKGKKTERKKNLSRIRAGKKATRPERRQRKREREREEKIFIIRYINPNGRNSVSRFSSKTRSCLSFPFYLLLWITKSKVIWISWSGSLSLFLSLKVLTNHSLFTLNGTTAGEEEEETRSAAWKCGFISRGILRLWEGLASQPASQLRDREKRIDSSFFFCFLLFAA